MTNFTIHGLCVVTAESERPLTSIIAAAIQGGCSMVQLRAKNMDTCAMLEQAQQLKHMLNGTHIPLIINDRVDIALAVDADGVHLGQSDMDVHIARMLLGKDKIIGLSVENLEQVQQANTLPIDYIGISPIFSTPTKTDTAQPFGLDGTRQAVALSLHPTIGIGGIHLHNIKDVMSTGLNAVAVVSEVMSADNPEVATRALVNYLPPFRYHRVLTIAGSDSGGGAGIQADIKAISACGCFATSAITAVTAQNTLGVQAIAAIPIPVLEQQICAVLDDIGTDAVKIGMLHSEEVVRVVSRLLKEYAITNIVLDPVMVSTSGHRLIEESAITSLKQELLPLARVITPNIPEAEILLDGQSLTKQHDLVAAARELAHRYGVSVLLKAGHLTEEQLVDILYDITTEQTYQLPSMRVHTRNTHGTGCTLSSALASFLAKGYALPDAAKAAKDYINAAIVAGAKYQIGNGFGAVAHFHHWWQ